MLLASCVYSLGAGGYVVSRLLYDAWDFRTRG